MTFHLPTFDAFGNITSESNSAVDLIFGFTGRLYDESTGLQNNLNRWYDPTVGRWLSEDPIVFSAGDANLYRYVGNGPTYATDPTGLYSIVIFRQAAIDIVETAGASRSFISSELAREMLADKENFLGRLPGVQVDSWENTRKLLNNIDGKRYGLLILIGHAHEGHRITLCDRYKYKMEGSASGGKRVPLGFRQDELNPDNAARKGRELKPNLADNAVIVLSSCYLGTEAMYAQEVNKLSVAQQVADGTGVRVLTPCYACDGGPEAPIPPRDYDEDTVRGDLQKRGLSSYFSYAFPPGNWVLTTPDPIT